MEPVKEHKKCKEIVEKILKDYPRARNDDLFLMLMVWQQAQQIRVFLPFDRFKEMYKPSSISRARRVIQNNEQKYLPTDQIIAKRRNKQKALTKHYGESNKVSH